MDHCEGRAWGWRQGLQANPNWLWRWSRINDSKWGWGQLCWYHYGYLTNKGSARNFLSQPGNAPQEEKCFRDVRAQALHLKAPRLSWTQGIRARDWSYTTARQGHSFRYSAVSATARHFTEIKASCCLIGIHPRSFIMMDSPRQNLGTRRSWCMARLQPRRNEHSLLPCSLHVAL